MLNVSSWHFAFRIVDGLIALRKDNDLKSKGGGKVEGYS